MCLIIFLHSVVHLIYHIMLICFSFFFLITLRSTINMEGHIVGKESWNSLCGVTLRQSYPHEIHPEFLSVLETRCVPLICDEHVNPEALLNLPFQVQELGRWSFHFSSVPTTMSSSPGSFTTWSSPSTQSFPGPAAMPPGPLTVLMLTAQMLLLLRE